MKNLLLFCFVLLSCMGYSQTFCLTVEIADIKKLKGNIVVSIYKQTKDFPHDGEFQTIFSAVNKSLETVIIKDLPKQEYAIAVYHDENSDGKCNTNLFGFSKEAYGFSNNVKPKLSAPSFDDCKIYLNDNMTITIKLLH